MIFKSDSKKKLFKRALAFTLVAVLALSPIANVFAQENASDNTESIDPVVQKKASLKPRGVRINLDSIPDWDPENLDYDELNRGSVTLQDRVKGAANNGYRSHYDSINSSNDIWMKKTEDGKVDADKSLTEEEMDEIIDYASSKGITIIPGLNSPGHMDAVLEAMVHLGFDKPHFYNGSKKSITTMDLEKPEVVEFTKEFIQLYINYFSNKGMKVFNFGADEYANDAFGNPGWSNLVATGQYDLFVDYANDLSSRILQANMRPLAFNDGFYYRGAEDKEFNTQLIIAYWTGGWWGFNVAPTTTFVQKGHDILNVNDSWYYVLGRESSGGYNRQSALNNMKSGTKGFDVNVGTKVDTIGSMIAFWADEPNATYEFDKLDEWIRTFAENNPEYFTIKEDEVNKDDLAFAIETVETALEELEGKITEESLQNLKEKLEEAKNVYNDDKATQEQVDKAIEDLKEALENVKEIEPETPEVNKEELRQTLDLMTSLLEDIKDRFTEESIKALEDEMANATTILEKEDASQEEVDSALAKLNETYKALQIKEEETDEVDTTALESFIEKLNTKLEEISDKLTDDSKANLENAIKEATELLESEDLTQDEVNDEILKLVDALASVEFKEEEIETPVVDTTALSQLIEKANARLEKDLEDESRENLENAIAKAKEILEKEDLTAEEYNETFAELLDALLNSKVKEEEPEPEQPEQPEDPKVHDVKGYIIGTTNVRVEPNGQIIGQLGKADYVEGTVTINSPNWLRIKHNGQDAYIYRSLIQNSVQLNAKTTGTVNVRQTPNGKILGTLKKGATVNGKTSLNYPNWLEIQYKGQKAYIYKIYVK